MCRPVIFMCTALYIEGVRLLTVCQLAQSPWQWAGIRVPALLLPPVWSLEESAGSCREGLLCGRGVWRVQVCLLLCVCMRCGVWGPWQLGRRWGQEEQEASWSFGPLALSTTGRACAAKIVRLGQTRPVVWVRLPPRACGNLSVLPSVHLSVCLSICILN